MLPERELRYLFDVNLYGPQFAMQAVIPSMRRQGAGTIVNITSILAKVTLPSLGMVGSSAGLHGQQGSAARLQPGSTHGTGRRRHSRGDGAPGRNAQRV